MTDQYEPVTADQLVPGDEIEITARAKVKGTRTGQITVWIGDGPDAWTVSLPINRNVMTITRKVKPPIVTAEDILTVLRGMQWDKAFRLLEYYDAQTTPNTAGASPDRGEG